LSKEDICIVRLLLHRRDKMRLLFTWVYPTDIAIFAAIHDV